MDETPDGRVQLKVPPFVEAMYYYSGKEQTELWGQLPEVMDHVPLHIVFGTKKDFL